MTNLEAREILEAQGFELEDPAVDPWQSIFLEGERVGTLYDDEIYLAEHMPSLFNGNYHTTSKHCVKYTESQAEVKLQSAIDQLKYSLREYEKEKRKQRVSLVRQYFKQRNDGYKLVETMDIQSRDISLEKLS